MNTEIDSLEEMKEDVEHYRRRMKEGWNDVRSSVDPRERVEEAIRRNPYGSVAVAAVAGVIAGSTFLPGPRRSPLGLVLGGMMGLAYRGFFMAATPVFAQRLADWAAPQPCGPASDPPVSDNPSFPSDITQTSVRTMPQEDVSTTGA